MHSYNEKYTTWFSAGVTFLYSNIVVRVAQKVDTEWMIIHPAIASFGEYYICTIIRSNVSSMQVNELL